MEELRVVKLAQIDPNPFRDGSGGTATWESVAEVYGFDEEKLKELQQSFETNGVWAGVYVRPSYVAFRYQLAFGHHRVEAARRMGLKSIPVIVSELGNDEMVRLMASENSEEYGHDFALGVMNAVEATVKAYAAGSVELEKPEGGPHVWVAPSFIKQLRSSLKSDIEKKKVYTPAGVSSYLGWSTKHTDGKQAGLRVLTAVSALELIELGALKRSEFKGLGAAQARELVNLTKRNIEKEKEKLEIQQEFLNKQKQAALKEDDKRKVAQVEKKLEELAQEAPKVLKQAGRQVASAVTGFFKEGSSYTEAAKRAAEQLEVAPPQKKERKAQEVDYSFVDNYKQALDVVLLDGDMRLHRILEFGKEARAKKAFNQLAESMDKLAERAKARAKELRKVVS